MIERTLVRAADGMQLSRSRGRSPFPSFGPFDSCLQPTVIHRLHVEQMQMEHCDDVKGSSLRREKIDHDFRGQKESLEYRYCMSIKLVLLPRRSAAAAGCKMSTLLRPHAGDKHGSLLKRHCSKGVYCYISSNYAYITIRKFLG
jgi:hypothetical protein